MPSAMAAQQEQMHSARVDDVRNAALDTSRISGLTHGFYNYPARFSPHFVREAIRAFSEPGDCVLDPFCGGGTTLVEAMALGRSAVGVDISSLSAFVTKAKTLLLTSNDEMAVRRWASQLDRVINIHEPSRPNRFYEENGYYRNVSSRSFWRIRKAVDQAAESIARLRLQNAKTIARCILLKSAQWALDNRRSIPSVNSFREKIVGETEYFLSAASEFREAVLHHGLHTHRPPIIQNMPIARASYETLGLSQKPRLIVTSPPYPGVHVLYHRWQVDGRKETPLPFMIANCLDGAGISYYAMGHRNAPEQKPYFDNIEAAFRTIRDLLDDGATVVQMIAFSQPDWQLARYLAIMNRCGFAEKNPWQGASKSPDRRLWRSVPNRKWHATMKGRTQSANEVVLVHVAR